jgi:hypothetical protein
MSNIVKTFVTWFESLSETEKGELRNFLYDDNGNMITEGYNFGLPAEASIDKTSYRRCPICKRPF